MPPYTTVRRVPELDGVRGIAITLVLIWHFVVSATEGMPPGVTSLLQFFGEFAWSGVDLFFVLSGFLLTGILLDSKGSERYFRSFYTRRCFRILPLYALIIAVYFLLRPLMGPFDPQRAA